ncbi:MAG: flagellar biosynthetic protein FliO [Candidatus Xenobiia bacterium LiM19]
MKCRNQGIGLPLLWKLCLVALLWLITAQGQHTAGWISSPCLAQTPSPGHSEKSPDASPAAKPSPTGTKEAENVKTTSEETPEDGRLMSPDPSESEQVNWIDEAKQGTKSDKEVQGKFYKRLWLTFVSLIIITIVTYLALRYIYAKQGLLPTSLKSSSKMIRIVERQMLQPQKAIYLVDVAGKYILIGISENRMQYLAEIERDLIEVRVSEMEQPSQANLVSLDKYPLPKPFSQLLEKIQGRKGDGESTPM